MNVSMRRGVIYAFAAIACAIATPTARAANLYWDTNGTTSGLGNTAGTWGTSAFRASIPNTIWNGTATSNATATTSGDSLFFGSTTMALGSTASTVGIVGGGVTINTIVFGAGQGTQGVTLSSGGGTITLAGTAPSNPPAISALNTGSNTIGAVIAGTAGMAKSGPGTLILTGANTYTGGTTINGGGTLQVGNGTSGSLTSQALTFNNGGGTFDFRSVSAGSTQAMGALTLSTTGAGESTVRSTYGTSGTTSLTFSSLAARGAGATGNFDVSGGTNGTNNSIVLTGASTGVLLDRGLFFGGSSYAAYDVGGFVRAYGSSDANYLAAPAGATMGSPTSASNVDLTTGNITAQTTASANTVNMRGNSIAIASGNTLSTNGTLSSGSGSATISGGTLQVGASGGELVIRVNGASDALDISSAIQNNSAASALTKSGLGTLTLSGTNSYNGTTRINAGTLVLTGGAAMADTAAVVLANAPSATLRLDSNETIGSIAGGGFAAGGVTGGSVDVQGNTLTLADNTSTTFGGAFSGSGAIVKSGSGTFTLSNRNTFAGAINVNAGSLALSYGYDGSANVSPLSSGGTITFAGGTSLNLAPAQNVASGVAGGNQNVGGQLISNAINISSGTFSIRTQGNDPKWDFSGGVTAGTTGTQTLSLLQGSLATGSGDRSNVLFSGVLANGSGGTLAVNVDFQGASGAAQPVYVALNGQNTFTGPIVVSNTKGLVSSPANDNGGYLVIGGQITQVAFGARTVTPGTGYLGGGNFTNTISLATGTILDYASTGNQTLSGVISGNGSIRIEASGTLALTAANTYAGFTRINAGTIEFSSIDVVANANPLGQSSTAATNLILGGGTLRSTGTGGTTDRLFSLQTSSTIDSSGTGAVVFNNTGAMGFNGGTAAKTLTLTGNNTGSNALAAAIANNTGATSVTKSGTGTWVLSGANTYTGVTTINGGGMLQFANTGSLYNSTPASWTASNIRVNNGTFAINVGGGGEFSTGNVTTLLTNLGGANGTSTNGFAAGSSIGFDTTNAGGSFTVADVIANSTGSGGGAVGVAKLGTGTLVLSNASTYTGATRVVGGTLAVNGSLANTAVAVGSGARLQGSGSVVGSVTIQDGGTLATGNSIESLATGALTLSSNSTFAYEIDSDAAPSVAGDLTAVTGGLTLALDDTSILTIADLGAGSWDPGEKLTLISYSGTWNGGLFSYLGNTLANNSTFTLSGAQWLFQYDDTTPGTNFVGDLTGPSFVTMVVVPEPAGIVLLGAGATFVALQMMRRRACGVAKDAGIM
jgi:autotransporter-associated beta strand protein